MSLQIIGIFITLKNLKSVVIDITSGTPDQLIVNSYLIKIFQQLDAFKHLDMAKTT